MAGILRTRERRIPLASLPCRAAFGTASEFSSTWPASGFGGPPPSCPGPLPGPATCSTATVTSTATTTAGQTVSRFAAAGIRVVGRGIRPLFGVILGVYLLTGPLISLVFEHFDLI